jgi:hypothetical protein
MPTVGFEHMIAVGERPYTYALDREATGTGTVWYTEENLRRLHCRQRTITDTLLQKKVRVYLDMSAIDFTICRDGPPKWKLLYGKWERRTVRLSAAA